MVRRRRRSLGSAALIFTAAAVGACGPGRPEPPAGPGGPPVRGGTLLVALRGDVDAWNPYVSEDATSAWVLELLYPRLVRETGFDGKATRFEPWLASSWESSPDGLALTFRLRRDAVWSDATPVTCEDVRFTFEAQTSEKLAWSGAFIKARIVGIECPDAWTAVFRFREAYAEQILDANDDAVVPAAYRSVPFAAWKAEPWEHRARTCGPFRLASVTAGQEAVLERDPRFWTSASTWIDRVVLRVYPDPTQAAARFFEGEVDLLPKFPPLRAAEAVSRPALEVLELPSLSYAYLGWNVLEPGAYARDRRRRGCDGEKNCGPDDIARLRREQPHPILADARVRRALALAVDRADLVEGLWRGHAVPGSSPIVSSLWAHDPATALPLDRDAATRLLQEAGWSQRGTGGVLERAGRRFELRVLVNAENQTRRDALDRVAASLAPLGARLVAEPVPRAEFSARARDKNFDAVLGGWVAGTRIEPQAMLHGRAAANRGNNLTSWSTPESDALLDEAAAAPTREAAAPLWRRWQAIFREEQPYTILYEERALLARNRRVRGSVPAALSPFAGIHDWWIASPATGAAR